MRTHPPHLRRQRRAAPIAAARAPQRTPALRRARRLMPLDVVGLQMIAGLILGLLLCEGFALLTGGAHVTVLFGGNG